MIAQPQTGSGSATNFSTYERVADVLAIRLVVIERRQHQQLGLERIVVIRSELRHAAAIRVKNKTW